MDKIICVGKNYLKHAIELGDEINEEPVYFIKPPSALKAISKHNEVVIIPKDHEVHHELEVVLRISQPNGVPSFTQYTLGLDLTLRALQVRLKKAGQPWEKSKVFANSAILGPWREFDSIKDILDLDFELRVNGQLRQKGVGHSMRWKPDEVLKDLQNWFPICDGDMLFTGTPEGVGPLKDGDVVEVMGGNIEYTFVCKAGHA